MLDLTQLLARPAIWTPDTSQEQWEEDLWTMLEASLALGDFANGLIDAGTYLDRIEAIGIDPLTLCEVLDGSDP